MSNVDELRERCISLLHKSIVIEQKVPSLQGVCEILNAIKDDSPKVDDGEIKALLATLVEQSEKANNLAQVKSNIADTL